jgi:hypothetical protein
LRFEFGYSGHPKKTKENKFGNNCSNPLESLAKNGISLEGITILWEKILANTPNPKLLQSIPVVSFAGHYADSNPL